MTQSWKAASAQRKAGTAYRKKMGNFEDEWRKVEILWDERGSHALGTNNGFCYELERK